MVGQWGLSGVGPNVRNGPKADIRRSRPRGQQPGHTSLQAFVDDGPDGSCLVTRGLNSAALTTLSLASSAFYK